LIAGVVIDNAVGVPEPSTFVLMSLVLLPLGSGRQRKPMNGYRNFSQSQLEGFNRYVVTTCPQDVTG